jgi:GntR family transcriptional regulator
MRQMTPISQPLYIQLADKLRAGILSKHWQPGDLLPSEPQLCREHNVSRGTVTRAIEILLREGLAHRRQGDGTYVSRPSLHRQPGFLSSFSKTVRDQGRVPSHRILGLTPLTRAQAQQYGCGSTALKILRLRLVDDTPWAIHMCVIPDAVVAKVPALQASGSALLHAADFSLYQAMEDAGLVVDHAEEVLRARTATADEAKLLRVAPHAALMTIHRKGFDEAGRILELMESSYVGDSYTYETRLTRHRGRAGLVAPHQFSAPRRKETHRERGTK